MQPAPDDVQPAPDDVQPAPDDVQPAPDDVQPAPDDVQPAPDDVQSAPDDVQSAPDDTQPARTDLHVRDPSINPRSAESTSTPSDLEGSFHLQLPSCVAECRAVSSKPYAPCHIRLVVHSAGGRRVGSCAIAPRSARQAALLAHRDVDRPGDDGERRNHGLAREDGRDAPRRRIKAHRGAGYRIRQLETSRLGARRFRADRRARSTRRVLHGRTLRDLSVDAGNGRGPGTFRSERQAAPRRHALARRASRLQHARDDAQRQHGRHAGRDRDRTRAEESAARRDARSSAARRGRGHGCRASRRSTRAGSARPFERFSSCR